MEAASEADESAQTPAAAVLKALSAGGMTSSLRATFTQFTREIDAVERLSRGIVSKLLHGPMSSLRGEGSTDDKKNTLSALKKMFGV